MSHELAVSQQEMLLGNFAVVRLNKYLPTYYHVLLATPARTVLCYAVLSGGALPDRSDAGMHHGRSAAEPR